MSDKKMGKTKTNILINCPCGAKAMIYQIRQCRWFAHCPSCGRITFIYSAQVLERVKAGGKLCPHNPELKPCKDGVTTTSWCKKCRVRIFAPMTP
jgi:hypothetical protein